MVAHCSHILYIDQTNRLLLLDSHGIEPEHSTSMQSNQSIQISPFWQSLFDHKIGS